MPREMKESGIEWIGEIPKDWKIRNIKGLFTVYSGSTPKSNVEEYYDGNICWITPADYKTSDRYIESGRKNLTVKGYESCGTTLVPKGSVIFSKRAPIGSVAIAKSELCTNQGCLACVVKENVSNIYYYYVFSAFTEEFNLMGTGTTFKEISYDTFVNFKIPSPLISEQQQIANYLDKKVGKIDEILEKTRQSIEEYKKLKQSVITEAVTKGIIKEECSKESHVEWIGKIPYSWNPLQLKYCTYVRARLGWKGLKADEYVESGYPLLSAFNIQNDKLVFDNLNFINKFRYDESPEIKLSLKDILLVKDGAGIGKCAIIEDLPYESTTNGSLAVITITKLLEPKYLYYYFLSKMFQKYIDLLKGGMGVPHLFQADLREINVVIPSTIEEQKEIVSYLDKKCSEIDKLIEKKEQLIKEMESYKKTLIYDCVTGKKEMI